MDIAKEIRKLRNKRDKLAARAIALRFVGNTKKAQQLFDKAAQIDKEIQELEQ